MGFKGLYQVSNLGRFKVLAHTASDGRRFPEKVISVVVSKRDGYGRINLLKDGRKYVKTAHRAVAEAFISNPEQKPQVNHINGNKLDNRVANLEWCTAKENQQHALATGLRGLNTPETSKPINMYAKSGNFMRTFPSASEAARYVGGDVGNISAAALGKAKTAYGYRWKYTRQASQ